jgi:hypothetical protein
MEFSLLPFGSIEQVSTVEIVGNIDRHENQLHLDYQLVGNLQEIIIAIPSEQPTRQDELWRVTCFELFLGIENTSQYWEFNLSPAGHWNVYRFDDYRQGIQRETAFTELPFKVDRQPDSLRLSLDIDLTQMGLADRSLDVAITAVIKQTDETVTYWALTHKGSQPDFHLRDSFILFVTDS